MSPASQNGFREGKVYRNFILILYNFVHKVPNFVTIPSCAIRNSNLGSGEMQFQDKKLDHNFVQNLYNFVHQGILPPPPPPEM